MKKINFLVDGYPRLPTGGLLVINRHMSFIDVKFSLTFIDMSSRLSSYKSLKNKIAFLLFGMLKSRPKWLHQKCEISYKSNLCDALREDSINICTTIGQALILSERNILDLKNLIYYAQHWEFWDATEADLRKIWASDKIKKITCSKWLYEYAIERGAKEVYASENGVYHAKPVPALPIVKRKNDILVMLSTVKWKRSYLLIGALNRAVKVLRTSGYIPKIKFFSLTNSFSGLPEEAELIVNPSKFQIDDLYSNSKLFLVGSTLEGFCLPAAEAMSHGCVLISSPCGGVDDFLINDYNGFVLEDFNEESLSKFIVELLGNQNDLEMPSELACQTFNDFYTFESASRRFEQTLKRMELL